jgi:hypothetical protein
VFPPLRRLDIESVDSFYTEGSPPFVEAMASSLHESGARNRRIPGTNWMYTKANQQYKDDIALQHGIADEVRLTDSPLVKHITENQSQHLSL